jgi:alanine racemase
MQQGRIWAEIDLDALEHNLRLVRSRLGGRKLLLAIKADAYGHGAAEIARALQHQVDMLGVASVAEGINLRANGVRRTPILVLSPVPYGEIPDLFRFRLSPTVTEREFAARLGRAADTRRSRIRVHLEIDTGMGRTGVDRSEAESLLQAVQAHPRLIVEGVFTHFPSADSDLAFTARQARDFLGLTRDLRRRTSCDLLCHAANTAGFLNLPASRFDMVRPGLIVYGILPDAYARRAARPLPVRPVMNLRARVVNLRQIRRGRSISYERRFIARRDSRIAVVSAGYGDGYPYALTNRGAALVRGERAPITGNVCMDLTMVDVTHIPGVNIGDVVTLLGRDGQDVISANELARWASTIPYEITCRVSPRVPRVFVRGLRTICVRNLLAGRNH